MQHLGQVQLPEQVRAGVGSSRVSLDLYTVTNRLHCSYSCMEFAACEDISTEEDPIVHCVCQMGKVGTCYFC